MDLTDQQWEVLEPLIPILLAEWTVGADPGEIRGMFSQRHPLDLENRCSLGRPAIDASKGGSKKAHSRASSKPWP